MIEEKRVSEAPVDNWDLLHFEYEHLRKKEPNAIE